MRKRINYDDDFVIVYHKGVQIYSGLEDDEPMKYENWVWNEKNKQYEFGNYTKVCVSD